MALLTPAQLLHRFGKKLRQLGRLIILQRDDLLWRLEAGGAIQWYSFWTGGSSGPSIPWTGCEDEYWVSFGLVEPGPGETRDVLDQDAFRQFAEEFSIDFKELRSLERRWVADFSRRLTALEYVRSFIVEKETFEHDFPGYSNMEAVPLLLPTVPMLPKCDIQTTFSAKYPMPLVAESPMNMTYTFESNAGQEWDNLLGASYATQTLDTVDTVPESDDGTSPSDSCVYSPPEDELITSHEPSTLPGYVASPGPASDRVSQRQPALITDYFSKMALQLLQACSIVDKGKPLSDDQIQNVINVHNSVSVCLGWDFLLYGGAYKER
ncbi:hypothetical protein BJY01DRAFT_247147 [Aspergillus pseudoustus]|uniref:Uncharacterized protein n=1 Tax=Aspergillus pseudoustus TaxID=1810923 RepID=A0ABR4K2R0_9EURO